MIPFTRRTRAFTGSDGKTYTLSPMTLDDFTAIDEWMRGYVVERAKQVYAALPEDQRAVKLASAMEKAETISFSTREGVALLMTPAGITQCLWLSLRYRHLGISLETVRQLVTAEALMELQKDLDEVNGLPPDPQRPVSP
jgi:hypothetical protein